MDFFPRRDQRHLDATGDREVVFCHACANEWWRDDHGILCPSCGSDITEIISPDSDPRFDSEPSSPGTAPFSEDEFDDHTHHHHHHFHFDHLDHHDHDHNDYDDDLDHDHDHGHDHDHDHQHPDPDEVDIETEFDPDGRDSARGRRGRSGGSPSEDDGSVFPILERYAGMINGFAPPPQHPGRADFFPLDGNERPLRNTHIHSTILRRGNTSVTIVSGPAHEFMGGGLRSGGRRLDPFATILSGVMRDMGLTNGESRSPDEPEGQGGPATNPLARGLAEILGLLNPANAVAGDAVYSQEALDRIITNLMEAHPQSNAAPPASEEALADLDRRFVDSKMLEGESNTECAICIDNMKVGDMAAFLPCKHWFHEECVVLWLKEHNTCPVCRASIERREANGNGNGNGGRNDRTNPTAPQNPSFLRRATSTVSGGIPILNHRSNSTQQAPRPPSQSQSRLNEVLRNMTSRASEQERDPARESARDSARESARDWDARERDRDRDWTQPFSYGSYDTSRLQRRTSLSPTSPRQAAPGDYRRMRQRSPSQSSGRRENRNTEQGGRPSMSAFNWFREQFANRGNSSRDNNRE